MKVVAGDDSEQKKGARGRVCRTIPSLKASSYVFWVMK